MQRDATSAFLTLLNGEGALCVAHGYGLQRMLMAGYGGVA
jgi:hypothetical protein